MSLPVVTGPGGYRRSDPLDEPGAVAYVLDGWPRLSETFIASEVYRLEQAGVAVRLFVIYRDADQGPHHAVVDRIGAAPVYLPPTTSMSSTPVVAWLLANLGGFLPALRRVARRRPQGFAHAAAQALAQAVRARPGPLSLPCKAYLKEWLQAVAVADGVLADSSITHLHGHFAHGSTVALFASTITGRPFSFTGHAKDIYAESPNPAGLLRRKLLAARFAVTCTEANRAYLQELAPEATVHRVYHGLNADIAALLSAAPAPPPANCRRRLLAVGRLVPKKGFDVLVEALAQLRDRGIDFEATIVGEGREHGPIVRARIDAHQLSGRVRLAGAMTQAALFDSYRAATVFCLPCRVLDDGDRDGIPNVLVEAMACRTPVVTTAVSGIPELVRDGENGLLVPPDDSRALASAIERVMTDPALAERLGRAGEATVLEHFDGTHQAEQLRALFHNGSDK